MWQSYQSYCIGLSAQARRAKGGCMRLVVLLVIAGSLWPSSAFSQERSFKTGNELYQECTAAFGSPPNILCMGYVMAASDALESQRLICRPKEVTASQAEDVIVNYLRDHPEQRHLTAYSLAKLALMGAFPCK